MNHVTHRLAARAGTRSAELIVHADAAGERSQRIILAAWRELLNGLRPGVHNFHANRQHVEHVLTTLTVRLWQTLHGDLSRLMAWTHRKAAAAMLQSLPKDYLRAAVNRLAVPVRESRLLEAGALAFGFYTPDGGSPAFDPLDLAAPLRHEPQFPFGAEPPSMTAEEERNLFLSLLFPPPSVDQLNSVLSTILPDGAWVGRVGDANARTPQTLANIVANVYAGGGTVRDVAKELKPYFDGSAIRATRTARTLGAFIGTERGLAASDGLGDLVIGQQVHSAGGHNARHNHALRNGTVYYKTPKPGQFGMDVCPKPPYDTGRGPYDETKPRYGAWVTCFN